MISLHYTSHTKAYNTIYTACNIVEATYSFTTWFTLRDRVSSYRKKFFTERLNAVVTGISILEGTPRAEIPILWVIQLSVSPPQPYRTLGERHKLLHRGPSGAPAENGFWCIWNLKEHI